MAARQAMERVPLLVLMHGFSGSGKTRVSADLMAALPAIRLRSDIERKRLFGLGETASSGSDIGAGIYSHSASERVYSRMFDLARVLLASQHSVILDAAFLNAAERQRALALAEDADCPAVVVDVTAGVELLRQRLRDRSAARGDASEADVAVLEHQLETADELSDAERRITIGCDNSVSVGVGDLVRKVNDAVSDR
jgi:predicted kinase